MLKNIIDLAVEYKEAISTVVPLLFAWIIKLLSLLANRKPKIIYSLVSQSLYQDNKTIPPGLIATRTYAVRNIGRKTAENVMFHVGSPNYLLSIVPDISANITYAGNSSALAQIQYLNYQDKFEVSIISMGDTCGELTSVRHKDGVGTVRNMHVIVARSFYSEFFFKSMYLAGIALILLGIGYIFREKIFAYIQLLIPIAKRFAA